MPLPRCRNRIHVTVTTSSGKFKLQSLLKYLKLYPKFVDQSPKDEPESSLYPSLIFFGVSPWGLHFIWHVESSRIYVAFVDFFGQLTLVSLRCPPLAPVQFLWPTRNPKLLLPNCKIWQLLAPSRNVARAMIAARGRERAPPAPAARQGRARATLAAIGRGRALPAPGAHRD